MPRLTAYNFEISAVTCSHTWELPLIEKQLAMYLFMIINDTTQLNSWQTHECHIWAVLVVLCIVLVCSSVRSQRNGIWTAKFVELIVVSSPFLKGYIDYTENGCI